MPINNSFLSNLATRKLPNKAVLMEVIEDQYDFSMSFCALSNKSQLQHHGAKVLQP